MKHIVEDIHLHDMQVTACSLIHMRKSAYQICKNAAQVARVYLNAPRTRTGESVPPQGIPFLALYFVALLPGGVTQACILRV